MDMQTISRKKRQVKLPDGNPGENYTVTYGLNKFFVFREENWESYVAWIEKISAEKYADDDMERRRFLLMALNTAREMKLGKRKTLTLAAVQLDYLQLGDDEIRDVAVRKPDEYIAGRETSNFLIEGICRFADEIICISGKHRGEE